MLSVLTRNISKGPCPDIFSFAFFFLSFLQSGQNHFLLFGGTALGSQSETTYRDMRGFHMLSCYHSCAFTIAVLLFITGSGCGGIWFRSDDDDEVKLVREGG